MRNAARTQFSFLMNELMQPAFVAENALADIAVIDI
jgi:hypothetical protein